MKLFVKTFNYVKLTLYQQKSNENEINARRELCACALVQKISSWMKEEKKNEIAPINQKMCSCYHYIETVIAKH